MSADSKEPAILARGVERRFGSLRVLRGVELTVATGDTVAIFGSNGAGKTTFVRVLAGLVRPNRGTVKLLGTELPGDQKLRRRLGMVGHEPFVYGDLTATENLSYYARLYGLPRDGRVSTALAAVELEAAADRPVRAYSRGMLQRLAIARAVLHEPEVLLLDEPFTGLDPHGAALLVKILGDVRRRAVTVVLTTHDFERGLDVADRAVLLHHGRVAWESGQALPDVREMHDIYSATIGADQG